MLLLAVATALSVSATDPADAPFVVEDDAPSMRGDVALALQHRGTLVLDAHVAAKPSDALSFELRQAFGVRTIAGDDALPYPMPIAGDTFMLGAWRPRLVAQDGHVLRVSTDAAIVAPLSFGSFGRTLGGAAGALGLAYRYVASTQAWRVDVRGAIDGVIHPVTWPLRVDGDLSGLATSGLLGLRAGDACTAQSLSVFRYACANSHLTRFGATLEIEARALDDELALMVAVARTQGVLPTYGGAIEARHIAGTSAFSLRASWSPLKNLDVGAGSWWWQVPFTFEQREGAGLRAQAPPLLPAFGDVLQSTWFIDVVARFDASDA